VNPPPAIGGAVLAAMLTAFRGSPATEWDGRALSTLLGVQRAILGFRREALDLSEDVLRDVLHLLEHVRSGRLPVPGTSGATVHTSAVDGSGLGCAITASAGYSSGEMPEGTGLWLNNCLGELELNRRGLSATPVGARLPSNMSPAVARKSRTVLAVGSPGADRITTALHQFMVHFIQRGMTLAEAVAHPRLHLEFTAEGMKVAVEPGLEPGDCGLPVTRYPDISMYFGGVAAALFDGARGFDVAADPRREGATFMSGEGTVDG
jgi:gamma-glutamyltranspeptidase/glutathione hydrolase